jgi:membrane-bound lytic murein transglycosylase A
MNRATLIPALLLGLITLAGCPPKAPLDYSAKLPPGELALRKIPPEKYPSFAMTPSDLARLHQAIQYSLEYMAKPTSQRYYPYGDITHDRAVATLKALDLLALSAQQSNTTPAWIDAEIRNNFEVYQSIGAPTPDGDDYTGQVRFTGYFTPIYNASLTRGGAYQWPIYKRPADLISDPVSGEVKGRRTSDGTIVPYYTRADIETKGVLAGQELCWLTSRFEAYVVTVQGSGRLRLPDGSIYEVGYAGQNGYNYLSAGERMVADGVIPADQVNLKSLHQYFDAHPADMDKYLSTNPRTVFFAKRPGGPFGSLNEPVTAMGTIATDKEEHDIYPRALAAFVVTTLPQSGGGAAPYRGFLMDQDTGGAIRAAGRADLYMGIGPAAEELAGRELNEGQMYYIAIKPEYVEKYK